MHSPFSLNHLIDLFLHLLFRQRAEPEFRASRLDGRCDLVDIITEDAESDVFGVLLDDFSETRLRSVYEPLDVDRCKVRLTSPQCTLRSLCHHIRLVQDDQLEPLSERSGHTVPYDRFQSEPVLSGLLSCNTTVADGTHENNTRVMAKPLICSLTTSIPRSSEALSSSTCERQAVGP